MILIVKILWFFKREKTYNYCYSGEINGVYNFRSYDELCEIEKAFNETHPDIIASVISLNSEKKGKGVLTYNMVSMMPIPPSTIVEFERMLTDGEIKINLNKVNYNHLPFTFAHNERSLAL